MLDQPAPTVPNRVWMGGSTYLSQQDGCWYYLDVWLNRCSRQVGGGDMRATMPENLVSGASR